MSMPFQQKIYNDVGVDISRQFATTEWYLPAVKYECSRWSVFHILLFDNKDHFEHFLSQYFSDMWCYQATNIICLCKRQSLCRCEQGSNLCGKIPLDFKSNALTTRPSQLMGMVRAAPVIICLSYQEGSKFEFEKKFFFVYKVNSCAQEGNWF